VQASSAKLGTSLVIESCYVSSVCYQVASYRSDQGADLRPHVRDLDKYMTDDIDKLSLNFFDPATRFLLNLLTVSGTTCVHVISR